MKKISILLIIALLFGACSSEKSKEDIKNEIFEYKEKIKSLEKELQNNPELTSEDFVKVKVIEAKKTNVKHSFTSTGTVKAENMAFISPEMNGQIKQIYVKEGQFVKRGQLLVTLNSDVILSSIKELKTGLELAKTMYEKQKTLWDQNIGKEIDYLQAKNKKESLEAKLATINAQYRMSRITAPFSGIVDEIYFKKGEMAMPGRQVIDLVNLNIMEVEADISEKYLPYIKKGDSVSIKFPTYPNLTKSAIVNRTGNIINRANRTFKVVAKIKNKDKKIKPNMIAEIVLSDYSGENYSIPSIIIKSDRKGEYIFIAKEENGKTTAEKRYIKTGMHAGDNTIIESGINEGEHIITEGYNLINSGTTIKIIK